MKYIGASFVFLLFTFESLGYNTTLKKVRQRIKKLNIYQHSGPVSISNSKRYVSVLRKEDGAEWIDVLYISELLRKNHEKKLIHLDPFPGSIIPLGWYRKGLLFKTNSYIIFRNPLHQKSILKLDKYYKFTYDPVKQSITPEKKILTAPIWYYSKVLTGSSEPGRKIALSQLVKIYRIINKKNSLHKEDWESLSRGIYHPPKGPINYLKFFLKRIKNKKHEKDIINGIRLLNMIQKIME